MMTDEPTWNGKPLDYLKLAIPKSYRTALFLDDHDAAIASIITSNLGPSRKDFQHNMGCWKTCDVLDSAKMISLFEDNLAHLFVSTLDDKVLVYMDIAEGTVLIIYQAVCRTDLFVGLIDQISPEFQNNAAMSLLATTKGAYHQRALLINSRLG